MRNLSSAGGMRQMVQIPLFLFKHVTKNKRPRPSGVGQPVRKMEDLVGPSEPDREE
jgi:hypothetical protein